MASLRLQTLFPYTSSGAQVFFDRILYGDRAATVINPFNTIYFSLEVDFTAVDLKGHIIQQIGI